MNGMAASTPRVVFILHAVLVIPGEAPPSEPPLTGQADLHHQTLDVLGRRRVLEEPQGFVRASVKHAIQVNDVEVKV